MTHAEGARVLVVDDEPGILRAVETNLGRHGFQVGTAYTGQEALDTADRLRPDVILLDLGLPDMDGLEVIRTIRKRVATPIIVLSARETEKDKVTALDLGADDYLPKPFGVTALLARVRVALRHAAHPSTGTETVIRFGDLELDLERRRVVSGGVEVHLTPTEWDLIKLFASHPDKVLTDRMIMNAIWGSSYPAQAHSLHVYVGRLRKKLQTGDDASRHILTEPGVGYRFASEGAGSAEA